MSQTEIDSVLDTIGIHPVLVDLGASGSSPDIWSSIAGKAVYVGFDPDSREMTAEGPSSYLRSHIVPCAVTVDGSSRVEFYLTRSPFCSSTLPPDTEALDSYLMADLFEVESTASVPATSLAAALADLAIDRVHWLKADTQGTDLRILESLPDQIRSGVLAVDIEPGLVDVYCGEDLFVDAHTYLVSRNFWPSRLDIKGDVRMRRATLRGLETDLGAEFAKAVPARIRHSPAWCEARYLRSIAGLDDRGAEDWALTWVFAMVDDQPGFALDLASEYARRFEDTEIARTMKDGAIARLREMTRVSGYKRMWRSLVPEAVRRTLFRSRRWLSPQR